MGRVEWLLKKNGPTISGELARLYENTYGVSNEAARKALSRAQYPVRRINSIKFDKNQKFYYLERQYMSRQYKDSLLLAIKNHSKVNQIYVNAFSAQNGYISKRILPSYTATPVENLKGHRLHEKVIRNLIDNNIVIDENEDMWSLNPSFFDSKNYNHAIGLEIAKKAIINDFNQWARENNVVASDKGKTLFENPIFAHFQWAYTAPSYIQPLYSLKNQKPGFVVVDVIYGKRATIETLQFFFDKLDIIRSFKNIPNFLPVILVDTIDRDALVKLKEYKALVGILNNFFSDKYTQLLDNLVNVITNTTSIINKNPELIYNLFDELSKSEGRYNNMAGDLFELLVGVHYSSIGCVYLKSKMIIRDNKKQKKIDLLISRDGKIIVVECKASKSQLGVDFVRKWLNENIPFIRKWLISNNHNSNIEFQLWSVGGFTKDAESLLLKDEKSVKKYSIVHYSRDTMIEIAKNSNDQNFINILEHHFMY